MAAVLLKSLRIGSILRRASALVGNDKLIIAGDCIHNCFQELFNPEKRLVPIDRRGLQRRRAGSRSLRQGLGLASGKGAGSLRVAHDGALNP